MSPCFLQAIWTGPDLDVDPLSILDLPEEKQSFITEATLQQKAPAKLACAGEPAYHLAQAAFLFRLALILLDLPYHHVRSVEWWRLRAWNVHAQLLGEPVAFPSAALEDLEHTFADEPDLVGQLWLERGLLEHYQSNDRAALECFVPHARPDCGTSFRVPTGGAQSSSRQTSRSSCCSPRADSEFEIRKRLEDRREEGVFQGEVSMTQQTNWRRSYQKL